MRTQRKLFRRILGLSCLSVLMSVGLAGSAQAQRGFFFGWQDRHHEEREHQIARDRGYQNGYAEGLRHGRLDGSRGFAFDYVDKRDYQEAEKGFRGELENRFAYQEGFRNGFARGYERGYHATTAEDTNHYWPDW